MSENWQTIEQAAVTLGLSVRTVNRHITNGKLSSRLFEGRREVLIPADSQRLSSVGQTVGQSNGSFVMNGSSSATTSVVEPAQAANVTDDGAARAERPLQDADHANASVRQAETQRTVVGDVPPEKPLDLQTMLTLADSIDDKASLAVAAYQTLAHSAEVQVQSLRRVAFGAWAAVGVLAVGVVVGVGWGMRTVTSAETQAEQLQRNLADQKDELRRIASERDTVRQELTSIRSQGDVLRGRVEVLTEQQRLSQAREEMAAFVLRQRSTTVPAVIGPAVTANTQPVVPPSAVKDDSASLAATIVSAAAPVAPTTQPMTQPAAEPSPASVQPVTRPTVGPVSRPFATSPRPAYTNEPDLLDPR